MIRQQITYTGKASMKSHSPSMTWANPNSLRSKHLVIPSWVPHTGLQAEIGYWANGSMMWSDERYGKFIYLLHWNVQSYMDLD